MLMTSVCLSLSYAAVIALLLQRISGQKILEFWLPFFSYSLLMGTVAALYLFRSKAVLVFRCIIISFCVISSFCTVILYRYYKKYQYTFSDTDVVAFLQSNFSESYSFTIEYILMPRSIAQALFSIILTLLTVRLIKLTIARFNIKLEKYILLAVGSFIAVFAAFTLLSQHYIIKMVNTSYKNFHKDIKEFYEYNFIAGNQPIKAEVKKEKGELYVIVIGESISRDHMHCYGGPVENTPSADAWRGQSGWIFFENAYSFFTHTEQALIAALTEGRTLTGMSNFPKGENIIGISKQAGIHTTWLSNQSSFGVWDNLLSALAHQADEVKFITNLHSIRYAYLPPDEALLPLVEQALEQTNSESNSLLIIHLNGSHSPYHRRYPEKFPLLKPDYTKFLGNLFYDGRLKKLYQQYVTSIKYTDHLLEIIHSKVVKLADRPIFLLYFGDHGEDVLSGVGHNFTLFTWTMARIPMFLWFSPAYQDKYPHKVISARANRNKIFTGDLIYDFYLGLADIKSESYLEEYDISSEKYCLTLNDAVIAQNKQVKNDPGIIIAQNSRLEHEPTLMVHRTNSLFKLKQAYASGLRNFEVDILCKEQDGQVMLYVGHDPGRVADDLSFLEYLEYLAIGFDFLYMDMKNLTEKNSTAVLSFLNDLDVKYRLRSKVLLETSNPQAAKILSDAGWSISYCLDWHALIEALVTNQNEVIFKLSDDIITTIQQNGIGGLSYDLSADEAVRRYILPKLPSKTKLYAWNTNWTYADPTLSHKTRKYKHLTYLIINLFSPFGI